MTALTQIALGQIIFLAAIYALIRFERIRGDIEQINQVSRLCSAKNERIAGLTNERAFFKDGYERAIYTGTKLMDELKATRRQLGAARGQITKLKNGTVK